MTSASQHGVGQVKDSTSSQKYVNDINANGERKLLIYLPIICLSIVGAHCGHFMCL